MVASKIIVFAFVLTKATFLYTVIELHYVLQRNGTFIVWTDTL